MGITWISRSVERERRVETFPSCPKAKTGERFRLSEMADEYASSRIFTAGVIGAVG
jgi:hypothetical protein